MGSNVPKEGTGNACSWCSLSSQASKVPGRVHSHIGWVQRIEEGMSKGACAFLFKYLKTFYVHCFFIIVVVVIITLMYHMPSFSWAPSSPFLGAGHSTMWSQLDLWSGWWGVTMGWEIQGALHPAQVESWCPGWMTARWEMKKTDIFLGWHLPVSVLRYSPWWPVSRHRVALWVWIFHRQIQPQKKKTLP